MDQIARDAFDDQARRDLFAELSVDERSLTDLGGFESFVFLRRDRDAILRVTHQHHRSLGQVLAELDWIDFLARNGAAVCTPVPQADGALAVSWRDFIVCEFRRARGATVTQADWQPGLFSEWGKNIGRFHVLTRQYAPDDRMERRPDCSEDENFDLASLIATDEADIRKMAERYRRDFMAQARSPEDFGLIHSDAHAGNFFIDNGKLTFFDFDDSCYCWFAYDIATILLSAVMQPWIEPSQPAREQAAREFLPPFLEGYASVTEPAPSMLRQLPLSLKFREICLYGVIRRFLPKETWDWYPARFMAGRRERILADLPYLNVDFSRL